MAKEKKVSCPVCESTRTVKREDAKISLVGSKDISVGSAERVLVLGSLKAESTQLN